MASRQTSRPSHAASALKARGFNAARDVRSFSKETLSSGGSESNMVSSWWKENGRQYSSLLSLGSLLALYGTTFYLKSLGHQSVQLVVSISLLAISLLNVHNYLTATDRRKVQSSSKISSLKTLPSNVHQSSNGAYTISYWKPSKYSETVFLNYNPLVPVLGYIWVRSFEPLAGFFCLFLMVLSTIILHIMVTKMRSLVQNELLMQPDPKPQHVMTTEIPTLLSPPASTGRSTPSEFPEETPVEHQYPSYTKQRRDMPASSIFQAPAMSNPSVMPLDDLAAHGSPPRYGEHMIMDETSFTEDLQPLRRSPQKSPSDPYSPPRTHLQGPLVNLPPHTQGNISAHLHQPKQPLRTPQGQQRTPFGLRLGAGSHHEDPSTPSHFPDAPVITEYRPFVRPAAISQQAPSAMSPFAALSGAADAPPPRFSMQDYQ